MLGFSDDPDSVRDHRRAGAPGLAWSWFRIVGGLCAGHGAYLLAVYVAAGLTGTLISNALQNAWVLGGFAMVFVVLSFSMFGFYNLQLPASLQSKLSDEAGHLEGGRGIGVFLDGGIVRPDRRPLRGRAAGGGAASAIGQTGNAVLGAQLFCNGDRHGRSPAGNWPFGGYASAQGRTLDGRSQEILRRTVARNRRLACLSRDSAACPDVCLAALLIVPAIYLHVLDPLPASAKGWQRF